ncbi:MAG: UTP--glucose-1-phosphate uridylyltransferase [Candidatus Beckwithbacteria bacterium]|nr:UTP--glucose-1-phosphate uridylyltransferase [Candidatus Beckwithbacteria bacterium]
MGNRKITKAVIAVAGYGTRFLPATKNQPKEMLPIIDKPVIQYLVEEAVNSGIKDIILVTRFGQTSLENHFDSNLELEIQLMKNGKKKELEEVQRVYRMANYIYVRQGRHLPYGNGTPLLCVQDLLAPNERFIYMFGDDLVLSKKPCTKQIMEYSDKKNGAVTVAVQEVAKSEVSRYGIYKLQKGSNDRVQSAVEKPEPEKAPSRLAQFGRFILNTDIVKILRKNQQENKLGKSNELWLIDAIIEYAKGRPVYAARLEGKWMTTGDPLRYLEATVEFALARPDMAPDFKKYLKTLDLS